jgi:sialidase-1
LSLWVSLKLKDNIDLLGKIHIGCAEIKTDQGSVVILPTVYPAPGLRVGVALRQHNDDGVHTYRIPGLVTTKAGSLLAIYDVRRDLARDLQGDIDIGLSRSTDGGRTWEPMRIAMDRGEWGGLPQKFNGISDACILVDRNSDNIFLAATWMHGVLDPDTGRWIENLSASSTEWNHQWRAKGSQPGFDVKQTSQFMLAKSNDDGRTWSELINLTRLGKQEDWWLWAPAPGNGITLADGTLVFPTQGRDRDGASFSNITWSKDGGATWTTSKPAARNTTECAVVQLDDGSLMLNMRDNKNRGNTSANNGRNIAITRDLGETWQEHPTSHGALIEPTCMGSLHKHVYIENGKSKSLLLFSNPSSKTARVNQTIKVSFDNGQTWPEEYWILLDEGRGRGYSCLTSIDEQTIGILYESSRADMTFQKISLSEILDKTSRNRAASSMRN